MLQRGNRIIREHKQDHGFPEELFKNFTDYEKQEFKCSVCFFVVHGATQCANKHIFCAFCLQRWHRSEENNHDCCPVCRVDGPYTRNTAVDEYLNKQNVICDADGCTWEGKLSEYLNHTHTFTDSAADRLPPILRSADQSNPCYIDHTSKTNRSLQNLPEISSSYSLVGNGPSNEVGMQINSDYNRCFDIDSVSYVNGTRAVSEVDSNQKRVLYYRDSDLQSQQRFLQQKSNLEQMKFLYQQSELKKQRGLRKLDKWFTSRETKRLELVLQKEKLYKSLVELRKRKFKEQTRFVYKNDIDSTPTLKILYERMHKENEADKLRMSEIGEVIEISKHRDLSKYIELYRSKQNDYLSAIINLERRILMAERDEREKKNALNFRKSVKK